MFQSANFMHWQSTCSANHHEYNKFTNFFLEQTCSVLRSYEVQQLYRIDSHHVSKQFLYDRTVEIVGRKYAIAWPKMEYNNARNVK